MASIEHLTAGHLHPYRALMLHAYEHAPDAFTSTAAERAAEPDAWWIKRLADPAGSTAAFGAFVDGALVGTVALEFSAKPKTRHNALLIGMYVRPEARGRGLARGLMQAAIAFCRRRGGIEVITLTVTDGNAPAVALYESAGFRTFGLEPKAIRGAAGWLAKRHLWLDLDALA